MTDLRITAAIALAAALSACSVAPQVETADAQTLAYAPPPEALDGAPARISPRRADACDIRVRRTGNGVSITPVAMLDRAFSGAYDLVLTKDGASGSTDATQSGPFEARAGGTVKLGQTELSLGRRDHYRAVLTLTDRGHVVCRSEIGS